jgi:23S rRNA (adenine2503-C2)-methyltransferase
MTLGEMETLIERGGFPKYRAKQLFEWVYRHGVPDLDSMTNLPKALRGWLAEHVVIGGGRLVRAQGEPDRTRKVLFELSDHRFIESVLMRDEGKERSSLCVSSQVGCAVGCTFCLTGYGGFQRQMTVDEIVGQVLDVRRELLLEGERLQGMVFMGMGEPMLNLDAVVAAIRLISDPEGIAMSPRRITVSTSGVIPGIEAFGRAQTGANLAVSLNATTDEVRTSIMPLNKRWPIADLIAALAAFPLAQRQRITVEYVLLKGINDSKEDAARLADLLKPLRCKVNLIMFNPHDYLHYEPVDEATLDLFAETLARRHYTVSVRWSKGREIEAACGQLAAHHFERSLG